MADTTICVPENSHYSDSGLKVCSVSIRKQYIAPQRSNDLFSAIFTDWRILTHIAGK